MQVPLHISFRDTEVSPALDQQIRERVAELDRRFGEITACHVVVSLHHRPQRRGHLFDVRIDLTVPGGEIVVNRPPASDTIPEDAHAAVRAAFDVARRQLEERTQRRRGEVKAHAAAMPVD